MANISAADVKKLRDLTGAGMMECKKALEEAEGDIDKAVEVLRISGAAKAAKRGAERTASNGLVVAQDNALVEVLCETDFVAKNEDFQALAGDIVQCAFDNQIGDREALLAAELPQGGTVADAVSSLAGIIGEKLELGRVAVLTAPVAIYLHRRAADLPPQVGVMVAYTGDEEAAKGGSS
jgi:translation elongation factor Ts